MPRVGHAEKWQKSSQKWRCPSTCAPMRGMQIRAINFLRWTAACISRILMTPIHPWSTQHLSLCGSKTLTPREIRMAAALFSFSDNDYRHEKCWEDIFILYGRHEFWLRAVAWIVSFPLRVGAHTTRFLLLWVHSVHLTLGSPLNAMELLRQRGFSHQNVQSYRYSTVKAYRKEVKSFLALILIQRYSF